MTLWHQQVLIEARLSELRREARCCHAASARSSFDRLTDRRGLQQRLGLLLVETGLYLLTRTDRARLKPRLSP